MLAYSKYFRFNSATDILMDGDVAIEGGVFVTQEVELNEVLRCNCRYLQLAEM